MKINITRNKRMIRNLTIFAILGAYMGKAQETPFRTERIEDQDVAMDAWLGPELNSVVKCQTCGVIVNKLSDKVAANEDWLVNFAIDVCKSKLLNVINPDTVCPSIVPMMAGIILPEVEN
jgi:hypothetical protein